MDDELEDSVDEPEAVKELPVVEAAVEDEPVELSVLEATVDDELPETDELSEEVSVLDVSLEVLDVSLEELDDSLEEDEDELEVTAELAETEEDEDADELAEEDDDDSGSIVMDDVAEQPLLKPVKVERQLSSRLWVYIGQFANVTTPHTSCSNVVRTSDVKEPV